MLVKWSLNIKVFVQIFGTFLQVFQKFILLVLADYGIVISSEGLHNTVQRGVAYF
jgi:hypothetical protein